MVSFPNCKINLGLRILDKRPDGFHNLETVFLPLPLHDGLEVIQNPDAAGATPEFSASGTDLNIPPEDNICLKAYFLLKKDFPDLPAIKIHLHKVIPHGAGLGGGSADAAFCLMMLNRKFRLGLTEQKLLDYAAQLGSDCAFFIINRPCLARGRGEILEPLALDISAYRIIIVNPGIQIPTAWAFGQLTSFASHASLRTVIEKPADQWRDCLVNDFEKVVFPRYPEIGNIREQLYNSGATYAAMSGTGSTLFGIFRKEVSVSILFPSHYFSREFVF